jgi:lipopolysaccharide export system protein LptA
MTCLRSAALIAMLCLVANALAAEPTPAKTPRKGSAATETATKPPPIANPTAAPETKPTKAPRPDGTVTETEIKAAGEATFDAGNHLATFLGGVIVTDPRFSMTSQKLTVYLKKDRDANAADQSATSGIDHAVAEGSVVIIQNAVAPPKPGEAAPEPVSGRSAKASFDPKTGLVVLTGNPTVRRGINEHIATSPSTIMTLTRDGGLRTNGPSKTIIRDTSKVNDLTSTTPKKP